MRKQKLIVHEKHTGKRSAEEIFASVILSIRRESNNNYGRGTDVQLIYKECDYDNVNYSFGKISGVKMLQCTKCNALSGVVDLQILSKLNEGNLEIAIYMNDNFIKNVNINSAENESIPYEKNDVIKVVAFCESAKCSVSVVRTVK